MLLSQYGARVYKIESPGAGDMGRGWGPPFVGDQAAYFLGVNAGKLGVALDLKTERGRELCLRMVSHADVVVENLRPGTMERLGLGWEATHAVNPRLIYCSISGYGQDGPRRDDPAMDLILQASSGLLSITGVPGGEVVRCGHSVADVTAGMMALVGILMALQARARTGKGQYVDVSMLDAMISAMCSNYANYLGSGNVPGPLGTAFATIVPYRCFHTQDRDVAIAVGSEKLWPPFCRAIGRPAMAEDPRYATNELRVAERGVLEPLFQEIFYGAGSEEWTERMLKEGVPCSPVRTLEDVRKDPQTEFRRMFPEVEHASVGGVRVTGLPVKLSDTPGRVERAAPVMGQHTRVALHDLLGLGEAEMDELAAAGVIAG